MADTAPGSRVRRAAFRLAFAAIGTLIAERVGGSSAPFLVAGALLGFFLGKLLGPLADRAIAELDPKRPPSDGDRGDRATQP